MTFDQQIKIITRVMGQAPRYSSSLAGARTREAWASVDDDAAGYTIFIHGKTEEAAMGSLFEIIQKKFPFNTKRHVADVLGEEEA